MIIINNKKADKNFLLITFLKFALGLNKCWTDPVYIRDDSNLISYYSDQLII
jgi:hypothetical protein